MAELFRREAVRHASRRLEGEVILAAPLSVRTTVARFSLATFSTPRISSIAQMLSSSWKTISMSGERDDGWARRR